MTVRKSDIRAQFERRLAFLGNQGFSYRAGEFRRTIGEYVEGIGIQFRSGSTPSQAAFTINLARVPNRYARSGMLCVYVDAEGTHGSQRRLCKLCGREDVPDWYHVSTLKESSNALAQVELCIKADLEVMFAKLVRLRGV